MAIVGGRETVQGYFGSAGQGTAPAFDVGVMGPTV